MPRKPSIAYLAAFTFLFVSLSGQAQAGASPGHTVRKCTLPVNAEKGVHYQDEDVEEMLAWGPSTLSVGPEGGMVIADAAASRLIELRADCSFLRATDLRGKLMGMSDVKQTPEGTFVLDAVAPHPVVLQLGADGSVVRRFPVAKPLAEELPDLMIEDGHNVRLGLHEGATTFALSGDGPTGADGAARTGMSDHGTRISAGIEAGRESGSRSLTLQVGDRRTEIEAGPAIVSFTLLGSSGSHIYARSVEVTTPGGVIRVRESIYRFTTDGRLDGVSGGMPDDPYVFVANRFAIDAFRDRVLLLLAYRDRAEIHEVLFGDSETVAREDSQTADSSFELPESAELEGNVDDGRCKVFPGQIRTIANGYVNNATSLTAENLNGTCSTRTKPRYLGGPKTYTSVPYDWGGWDSVAMFNDFMADGKQAGDVNTDKQGNVACSKGVDCSGFVSQVWKLSMKKGSATLGQISTRITKEELRFGDVINKDAHHVVLVDAAGTDVKIYESTKDQKFDRVVRRSTPWTRYSGYKFLRYNNYCEKAAGQLGCAGRPAQLFVDVPINLTGGPFSGRGSGHDYDGDPLYFTVTGNFNRTNRNLSIDLTFYTDPGYSDHVRTDRCEGSLDANDRFSDSECQLIRNTSAGCLSLFLTMSLRGEADAGQNAEPSFFLLEGPGISR